MGMLPIHLACWKHHFEIVKFFLLHNSKIIDATDKASTALQIDNSVDNRDLNLKQGGWRPIHIASYCGDVETIRLLIENKCEIDCCNNVIDFT